MDDYPRFSLDHNVPLLVTLGVPSEESPYTTDLEPALRAEAVAIESRVPPLDSDQAQDLLSYILDRDASDLPWNGRDAAVKYRFRVRTAERTLLLPSRQARLPENIEPPQSPVVLHSPYSPLSPASPLYPDGLIDARWVGKHQELIPSVILGFYSLTTDSTQATLEDNKLKSDINGVKAALQQSGYKSRLAVMILSEQKKPSAEVQERLENIRRGCGIDPKCFFFIPAVDSQDQLERFAENAMATIYAQALNYYSDMSKHVRKKRSRGVAPSPTVPPTSGTSQTLSLQDWNVRYDFKSGVFAEYRQEMDVAFRSYEQAYENLLSSEVAELIPNWSPRFNEARQLADILSIRTLRCLLWAGQTTAAVRRWQHHRDRIADLVDRRGSSTNNYGWQAWEARWATVMANLLERAKLPDLAPSTLGLYMTAEKGAMVDRIRPWELLHHTGYWYRLASRHLYRRRAFALAIPEDDRRAPASSPASRVANKAFTYDTYMCPEPHEEYPLDGSKGVNHSQLITDCIMKARSEFQKRQQLRLAAELSLECSREFRDPKNVVLLLEPLWRDMSFRTEGWLDIAEELSWNLRKAAYATARADLVVTIDWELLNQGFTKLGNWLYDLNTSLQGMETEFRPAVKIHDGNVLSFLSTSFIFKGEEGKAGETAQAQLSVTSRAHPGSAPITVDRLQLDFVGSIRTLVLEHKHDKAGPLWEHKKTTIYKTHLEERTVDGEDGQHTALHGDAELTLKPGETRVFNLDIPLREPGEANAASARFFINSETFDVEFVAGFKEDTASEKWYMSASTKKHVSRANAHSIRILPRPPKMEIKLLRVPEEFYTNENIDLQFELVNAEEEKASTRLDVTIRGDELPPPFTLQVAGNDDRREASTSSDESEIHNESLGSIEASKSGSVTVRIEPYTSSATFEITVQATYHLESDHATSIIQTATFPLVIVNPFEANYDLTPRLHPDSWPTLFNYEATGLEVGAEDVIAVVPRGISQAWCLITRYASFAMTNLIVKDLDIQVKTPPSARCYTTQKEKLPDSGREVTPKTIEETSFDLVAQKMSLDERGTVPLDVSFIIKWTRLPSESLPDPPLNTTTLAVPRLNIFGMEPRVLGSVSFIKTPVEMIELTITIENASNHFLTFGLTMEPSDEFAFSGSKQTTMHVLPVSRRSTTYRLVPLVRDVWIRPNLVVRDKYFQKVLRVIPTEGMKPDKDGFLVWVPAEEEEEEEEEEEDEERESSIA